MKVHPAVAVTPGAQVAPFDRFGGVLARCGAHLRF